MDTVLFNHLWNKAGNFLSKFKQQEEAAPIRPVNTGPNIDSIDAMHLANSVAPEVVHGLNNPEFDADIIETQDALLVVELDGQMQALESKRGIMVVFTAKDDFEDSVLSKSHAIHVAAPGNLSAAEMRNHFDTAIRNQSSWAGSLSSDYAGEEVRQPRW